MDKDVTIKANVTLMNNIGLFKGLIVAEFRDRCNMCFEYINAGEKVAWYGKGFGVRHYSCFIKRDTLLTNEEFDNLSDW